MTSSDQRRALSPHADNLPVVACCPEDLLPARPKVAPGARPTHLREHAGSAHSAPKRARVACACQAEAPWALEAELEGGSTRSTHRVAFSARLSE